MNGWWPENRRPNSVVVQAAQCKLIATLLPKLAVELVEIFRHPGSPSAQRTHRIPASHFKPHANSCRFYILRSEVIQAASKLQILDDLLVISISLFFGTSWDDEFILDTIQFLCAYN